jgi:hypothetical protein
MTVRYENLVTLITLQRVKCENARKKELNNIFV